MIYLHLHCVNCGLAMNIDPTTIDEPSIDDVRCPSCREGRFLVNFTENTEASDQPE